MKNIFICILCCMFLIFCLSCGYVYAKSEKSNAEKIKVFVSILPQAYFVKRVGGEIVEVSVMVSPGQSPATYEPVPRQMVELGEAELFFYIGVPFENIWLGRISKVNPQMKLVDTRRGIKLLPMKTGSQKTSDSHVVDKTAGLKDPHIWMSLRLVKIQAQNICEALINHDPVNKDYYQNNLRAFILDLDSVDAELIESLKDIRSRKFMVFHPAWGYFARDYGLEQIPIEIRGKAPGAKVLADLIDKAKKDRIKIIFVQKQFSKKSAEALAHAIGGKTIQIDPLAMDYLNNMKIIAENLKLQFGNYE